MLPGLRLDRHLVSWMLAVVAILIPTGLRAQEQPRCFEVSSIDHRLRASGQLQGEILCLTREPYSRGLSDVVWRQAFLGAPDPEPEPLPWRELSSDSIEVRLGLFDHVPSELVVADSGGTLRGYIRVYSDDVGTPPGRYSFLAEATSCKEEE